jgi:hypothetical protein
VENNNTREKGQSVNRKPAKWQIQIFLLCLLISAIIWLFVKLSKDYPYDMVCPVIFQNIPSGMMLTGTTDSVLLLNLVSNGYNILANKFLLPGKVLEVDLSEMKLQKKEVGFEGILTESVLRELVGEQLNRNEKLTGFSPSTVLFRCEHASVKRVPVIPNIRLEFAKQHFQHGAVRLSPDSVTLTGPPELVSGIESVTTEYLKLSNLKESRNITVKLGKKSSSGKVSYSTGFVDVHVPVAEYEDASMQVRVTADSVLKKYAVRFQPDKVGVRYRVAVQDAAQVRENMFRVVVRYDQKMKKRVNKAPAELVEFPAFVHVTGLEPETVEYRIFK